MEKIVHYLRRGGGLGKKGLSLALGLLLISISNHLIGFDVFQKVSKSHTLFDWKFVISILLGIGGLASLYVSIFVVNPAVKIGTVIKKLCILAGVYFAVQLLLGLVMGFLARGIQTNMNGEDIKTTIDVITKILQIPIRAGAMAYLISLLTDEESMKKEFLILSVVAYIIYTLFQSGVGFMGTQGILIALRVLISTAATVLLWVFLYWQHKHGVSSGFKKFAKNSLVIFLVLTMVTTPNTVTLAAAVKDTVDTQIEEYRKRENKREQLTYLEENKAEGGLEEPQDQTEETTPKGNSGIGEDEAGAETGSESGAESDTESDTESDSEETDPENQAEEEVLLRQPELEEDPVDIYGQMYGEPVAVYEYGKVYQTDSNSYKFIGTADPEVFEEDGELKEIDNALVEEQEIGVVPFLRNGEENTYYTNADNQIDIKLPAKMWSQKGLKFTNKEGRTLEVFPYEGIYENAVTLDNAILYNEVFENIDVQYTLKGNGVKEDIILRENTDKNTFTYSFSNEEYAAELENNTVSIFDKTEEGEDREVLFYLNAPVMIDGAGNTSDGVTIHLSEDGDHFLLTIEADREWLDQEERVYPVKVDPTITVPSDNLTVITTSSRRGTYSEAEYGYAGYVSANVTGVSGGVIGKTRMFYKINYGFTNLIPADAVVTSATLNAYEYSAYPSSATFVCYRLTEGWNPATISWENSINIGREVSGEQASIPAAQGWKNFDIRQSVNDWIAGIAPQHGLMIMASNELEEGAAFYTPNSGTTHQPGFHPGLKPYIEINWSFADPVAQDYPLDDTTVVLRSLVDVDKTGKLHFQGVFADGIARPGSKVGFSLNDTSKGYLGIEDAGNSKKYPNSETFESAFPATTNKYRDKQGNWQTAYPFTTPDFDKLYKISASAVKDGVIGKENASDTFTIYKVKQFDTLPRIASYYGIPLSQIIFDNRVQDMLLVENNTLFIRNPRKNGDKPYNPAPLDDDMKAQIDAQLMGRGLHCEFGFEPVNLNTGNFYLNNTDATIPDFDGSFDIERNYNSKGAGYISPFGRGWQFTYGEYLSKKEDGTLIYTREDGSSLYFKEVAENQYECPEGYDLELNSVKIGEKTYDFGNGEESYPIYEYEIKDSAQVIKTFDRYGSLTKITNQNGNETKLSYDENLNLKSVTSAAGNTYQFTITEDGKVEKIQLPNGGVIAYEYDEENNLISYTDASGAVIRYEYDDEHRMTAWYDGKGAKIVENTYDEEGRVVKQLDANGYQVTLEYNGSSTTTIDGNGNQVTYHYDDSYRTTSISYGDGTQEKSTYADNRLVSETDSLGHTTKYGYDEQGNVTSVTRFDGKSRISTYDDKNNLLSETDFEGIVTTYQYDDKGNILSITKDGTLLGTYNYDDRGRLTAATDANGNQNLLQYTGALLTGMVDAKGNTTSLSYDSMGLVTTITDGNGNTSSYTYDLEGRQTSETNGAGDTTTYTIDVNGQAIGVADGNGNISTFTYDALGNLIGGMDAEGNTIAYEYDGNGNRIKEVDGEGYVTTKTYDSKNRVLTETDGKGGTTSYTYDAIGNILTETDAKGQTITYTYDYRVNEIASAIDGEENAISFTYSPNGKLLTQNFPDGSSENYKYDGLGREIEVTEVNGLVIKSKYDEVGNLIQIDKEGVVTSFTYDALNQMTKITYPNGGTNTMTYDKAGNTIAETNALNETTKYVYDGAGRTIQITDPEGGTAVLSYDGNGNLSQITDAIGGSTTMKYNSFHEVTEATDPLGYVTKYEYDSNEQVTKITDALGVSSDYEYDALGMPVKITDGNGNSYQMTYDANGNYKSITAPDGGTVTYDYNDSDQVIKETDSEGLISEYEYDENGLLLKQWDNQGGYAAYTYDQAGNILTETNVLDETTAYTYDKYGNLTEVKEADGNVTTYTYDKMFQLVSLTDPEGKTTTYDYNLEGQLIKETDGDDRTYQYQYDKTGQLISVINPLGEEVSYAYDKAGNLLEETDESGKMERYTYNKNSQIIGQEDRNQNLYTLEYDPLGNIKKAISPEGGVEQFSYDNVGNLLAYTDGEGAETAYTYDAMNRVREIKLPTGGIHKYDYNTHGSVVKETKPEGAAVEYEYDLYDQVLKRILPGEAVYEYEYDPLGRLTKQSQPEGLATTYKYDISGNLMEEVDQSDRTVSYVYDKMHRLLETKNTLGLKTSYTYDENGNLNSYVTPMGHKTTFTYDVLDRMQKAVDPTGMITELKYDVVGNIKEVTENGGHATKYTYDGEGNMLSETNALDQTTKYSYDSRNRLMEEEDAAGSKTQYGYDQNDRLTKIRDANGSEISMEYDGNGNISSMEDGSDRSIRYEYDKNDRLLKSTTGEDTEAMTVSYQYDDRDNLITQTDGNGNTTNFTYDKLDKLTAKTNPLSQMETYEYDINARLTKVKRPSGKTIQYDYNQLDQLLKESYGEEGEEDVLYSYDEDGRRVGMADITGDSTYTYDDAGRITGVQSGDGNIILYNYDSYGNLSKLTYPDGVSVSYEYDDLNRLTKVKDREGEETLYTYDLSGNMTSVERANNTSAELTYDLAGQVTMVTNYDSGHKVISQFAYLYDGSGNIVTETIYQEDGKTEWNYSYNSRGELSTAEAEGIENVSLSYGYDYAGNKVEIHKTETKDGKTTDSLVINSYNSANQLVGSKDNISGQTKYQYDADGNLIREIGADEAVYTYSYDTENRLRAIHENGSLLQGALYDGDDNRVFVVNRKIETKTEPQTTEVIKESTVTTTEEYRTPSEEKTTVETTTKNKKQGDVEEETKEEPLQKDGLSEAQNGEGADKSADNQATSQADPGEVKETTSIKSSDDTDYFMYGFLQSLKQGFSISDSTPGQGLHINYEKLVDWYHVDVKGDKPNEEGIVRNPKDELEIQSDTAKTSQEDKDKDAAEWQEANEQSEVNKQSEADKQEETDKQKKSKTSGESEKTVETREKKIILPGTKETRYHKETVYEKVFIPNGVKDTDYTTYNITNYINDINQEYTETLMEYGKDGDVTSIYEYGNDRLSYKTAQESQYYAYNGRGSVSNLTGENGQSVLSYNYDVYGAATASAPTNNPYTYNGEYTDHLTGNQYLRARYYNPSTGTFTTEDSYFGSLLEPLTQNRYTYTGNDPINLDDPSGHGWLTKAKKAVKKAASTVAKAAKKVATTVKKAVKKVATTVKTVAKKVTSAVKKTVKKTPTVKKVVKKATPAAKKVTKKATKVNINQTKKLNKTIKQVQMGTPIAFKKIASKRQNIKAGGTKSYLAAKNGAFYTGMNMSLKGSNMVWVGNSLVSKYEKKGCTTARHVSMTSYSSVVDFVKDIYDFVVTGGGALYDTITKYGGYAAAGVITVSAGKYIFDEWWKWANNVKATITSGTSKAPAKSEPHSVYYRVDEKGNILSKTFYDEAGSETITQYESKEGTSGADTGNGSNNDDDGKKPKNPQKANDKQLKKNGHDAHEIKKEYLGKKAPISKYDLYVDKTTGRIWIYLKGGKGVPTPTDYFMK